jgi:hypothetical protein
MSKKIQKTGQSFQTSGKLRVEAQYVVRPPFNNQPEKIGHLFYK